MNNIRIVSQKRGCYNGRKWVEFFEVLADSERFGVQAVMYQGDFNGCVDYLKRHGIDYTAYTLEQTASRGKDVQIGNRMFRVVEVGKGCLLLKARDYIDERPLSTATLQPIAPETFTAPKEGNEKLFRVFPRWQMTATVKVGTAKVW